MKLGKKLKNALNRLSSSDLNYFEEQFRYGHREILLNYAIKRNGNLNKKFILRGGLEHGWAPGGLRWVLRNRNLTYANRYIWHERRLTNYKKHEKAIAVGAPWLYMLSDLGIKQNNVLELLPKLKNKIIVFPSHNTLVPININIINELKKIKSFIPESSEVTVCLFWLDFCNSTTRNEIRKMGWEVFSAGIAGTGAYPDTHHGGRPNFLLDLFGLLKDANQIIVTSAGTAMFYGLSLGAKIQYIETDYPIDHWGSPDTGKQPISKLGFTDSNLHWLNFYFPEIFKTKNTPERFIDFSWNELGVKSFKENEHGRKFEWIESNVNSNSLIVYQSKLIEIKSQLNMKK
jgi:hypothetical protein